MKQCLFVFSLSVILMYGFSVEAGILGEETDCSQWEARTSNPNWSCIKASNWAGSCIPGRLFEEWNCLEVDSDAVLCDEDRPFNMTVYFSTSGMNFDCNNQVIDHQWKEGDTKHSGMRLPQRRSVSNINIQNCTIRNVGRYGINLKRFFRGEQLDGPMNGHRNIEIRDIDIINSRQTGIYVGQNSRYVTMNDVYIERAYSGIYLEAGSTHSYIVNSTITETTDREAISVDSSMYNTIEYCTFDNNKGGIHLYKNCGETRGQVCPIRRKYSASNNVIRGNRFQGDAVEVAWRQYKLYAVGHCIGIDILGFWRDRSDNNQIYDNTFVDGADLYVKDGPNTVYGNNFSDSDVILGKNAPVGDSPFDLKGNVAENRFDSGEIFFDTNDDIYEYLAIFNNVDGRGQCLDVESMNTCSAPTVLWGDNILPAGIVTVVY